MDIDTINRNCTFLVCIMSSGQNYTFKELTALSGFDDVDLCYAILQGIRKCKVAIGRAGKNIVYFML